MSEIPTRPPRISFLQGRVLPFDGKNRSNRGWRLLAFLLWKHHLDQVDHADEPTMTLRSELKKFIGINERPPIVDLRTMLGRVNSLGLLVEADASTKTARIALTDAHLLPCDLAELLFAVRENDRERASGIIPDKDTFDQFVTNIERTRGGGELPVHVAAWIKELTAAISAFVMTPTEDVPLDLPTERYLEAHRDRCRYIDLRDLGSPVDGVDARLPLEDVYVSLIVGPRGVAEIEADRKVTSGENDDLALPLDFEAPAVDDLLVYVQPDGQSTIHFTDLVCNDRWCVVLGEPGAGKTTLLHWLAYFNARAMLTPGEHRVVVRGARLGLDDVSVDLGPARLPMLVRIGEWASENTDPKMLPELDEFLGRHTLREAPLPGTAEDTARIIHDALAGGRALVLLDGLDEVDNAVLRKAIVDRVERFVEAHISDPVDPSAHLRIDEDDKDFWGLRFSPPRDGGNQIIVTSRVHGYKQAPLAGPFQLVRARRLDLPVAERFARQWFLALERARSERTGVTRKDAGERAAAQSEKLIAAMRENPNVCDLASNPLLITVLAAVQAQSGTDLPTTRAVLYERAIRVLTQRRLGSWSFEQIVAAVAPFALWLQTHRPRGVAKRDELEEHLRAGIAQLDLEDPDGMLASFVNAAQRQSGLLVEYGNDRYGFPHASFREYLAAVELSRLDTDAICAWLDDHLHDARWTEVVLLLVATLASTRPADADEVLDHVVNGGSSLEALLHHDLMMAGDALTEIAGSSTYVEPVIIGLLNAAEDARRRAVPAVGLRVMQTLQRLIAVRGEETIEIVVDALADEELARAGAQALSLDGPISQERLEALDLAARCPAGASLAGPARQTVAIALLERGHDLPEELNPLGHLWGEGSAMHKAYMRTESDAPRLRAALVTFGGTVRPGAYGLLRSALAAFEDGARPRDEEQVIADIVTESREVLIDPDTLGADFVDIAQLAFALDAPSMRTWLAEQIVGGTVDVESAVAFYDTAPLALPLEADIADWLDSIEDERAVTALLSIDKRYLHTERLELAWRRLGVATAAATRPAATRALTAEAFAVGRLAATHAALDAVVRLMAGDADDRLLATALMARLRLAASTSDESLTQKLEAMMALDEPMLARCAAALLASRPAAQLTAIQYDLLAASLAANDDLRTFVSSVLINSRPAIAVGEDVLERALHHRLERLGVGDIPAAGLHDQLGDRLRHADAARIIGQIEAERVRAGGEPGRAATDELLLWASDAGEKAAEIAINTARWAVRDSSALGLDHAALAEQCLHRFTGKARRAASGLLVCDSVLSGDIDLLDNFFERLAAIDGVAVVEAIRDAGHVLESAPRTDTGRFAEIATAALDRPAVGGAKGWERAGARLVMDIHCYDLDDVLVRFHGTRASAWARALVYALDTDMIWLSREGSHGNVDGPRGLVVRRLGLLAEQLGRKRAGMQLLASAAMRALEDKYWPQRRAALFALDAAAGANPAHFLREARKVDLRAKVISGASDEGSFSVRRIVISLLSRFREFDQAAAEVVSRAAQDAASVSQMMLARCDTFEGVSAPDIAALREQLGARSVQAMLAAATLLTTAARTARLDRAGVETRRDVIAALVDAASRPDPLLDSSRAWRDTTVRQALHDMLAMLVWKPPSRRALDAMIGRAASPRTWDDTASPKPVGLNVEPDDSLDKALRAAAESDWLQTESRTLMIRGKAMEWPPELGELTDLQIRLLALASYSLLEIRVGSRLANAMTNSHLEEFEGYHRGGDDAGALEFLSTNFPYYPEIVENELDRVVEEARTDAATVRETLAEFAGPDAIRDLFEEAVTAVTKGGSFDGLRKLPVSLDSEDLERSIELLEGASKHLEATEGGRRTASQLREHAVALFRAAAELEMRNDELDAAEEFEQRALGILASIPADYESDAFHSVWLELAALSQARKDEVRTIERLDKGHIAASARFGIGSRQAIEIAAQLASAVVRFDLDAAIEILRDPDNLDAALAAFLARRRAVMLRVAAEDCYRGWPAEASDDAGQAANAVRDGLLKRMEEAIARAQAELSSDDPEDIEFIRLLHTSGIVASLRNDLPAADNMLTRALAGKCELLGLASPDTEVTLKATVAVRLRYDVPAAIMLLQDVADDLAELSDAPTVHGDVLRWLVRALQGQSFRMVEAGDVEGAETLHEQAMDIAQQHSDVGGLRPGTLRREIAATLRHLGQSEASLQIYESTLAERVKAIGGYDDDDVRASITGLIEALSEHATDVAHARIDVLVRDQPGLAEWLEGLRERILGAGD
jgi:hypothetical protein